MMVTTGGRVTSAEHRLVVRGERFALQLLLDLVFEADDAGIGAELPRHIAGEFFIERLVDRGEYAASQQARNQILRADFKLLRQDL